MHALVRKRLSSLLINVKIRTAIDMQGILAEYTIKTSIISSFIKQILLLKN